MTKILHKHIGTDNEYIMYECPGCKHTHRVPPKRWNWNGDLKKPTLSPSVRHFIAKSEYGPEKTICHYFIRNGNIEYCNDCEHTLSGKTVTLPDIVERENYQY